VSAVAGCWWFDGRPAGADDVRVAGDAARHRARQPFRVRCEGSVALAYAADAADSCQPFHHPAFATTIVIDGRLDNLTELADALGVAPPASAPAVVLAAWRRWGVDCGTHLLGDFVVVVSDETARRVVCIRDPMGQRPLFHGASAHRIVFASEAHQVVRQLAVGPGGVRPVPNEGIVAEYLTGDPATVAETIWRGVYRLPPAHTLEITASGATVRRYWDFDPGVRIRYARDAEYADHFREIFKRAVECRVRGVARAGVFLSGGIDSSVVAGVAHEIRAAGQCAPLEALTLTFPGQACDESGFSQAVAERWGLPATRIDARRPVRDEVVQQAQQSLDVPAYPTSLAANPLRAHAAAAGVQVLLTGFGGDDFFTGESSRWEILREGHVLAWTRAMVSPMLSDRARDVLRPVFGARRVRRPWIQPALAARTALEDRLRPRSGLPFPTREQQEIHRAVGGLVQVLGDEMEERAAQAAGVEQRHPFYDRRVAEFGLAVPGPQRADRSGIKVVIRHALGDYLPPSVAARTRLADKAEFSSTYVDALEAFGGREAFLQLRSEDAGWVDGRVLRQMYDEMIQLYRRGSDAYIAFTGPLWAVASLEVWLDAVSAAPLHLDVGSRRPDAGASRNRHA